VVVLGPLGHQQIVSVGRQIREEEAEMAGLALLVLHDRRGEGLDTLVHGCLAQIAKSRGLRGFRADILRDNSHGLHVVTKVGAEVSGKVEPKLEGNAHASNGGFEHQWAGRRPKLSPGTRGYRLPGTSI
jgi:hypothetical protein